MCIKKLKKVVWMPALATLVMFVVNTSVVFAIEGGANGGGGTLVTFEGKTGLVDLYVSAPEIFTDAELGIMLPESNSMKAIGVGKITISELPLSSSLMKRVKALQNDSPTLYSYLRQAFERIPLYASKARIAFHDKTYVIPEDKLTNIHETRTAALYISNFGVFISKPDFESLSRINQEALILHELFRHLQITYDLGFTNEKIQKLTAKIMRGVMPGESLETPEYVSKRILDQVNRPEKRLAEVNAVLESARKELPEYLGPCHISQEDLTFERLTSLGEDLYKAALVAVTKNRNRLQIVWQIPSRLAGQISNYNLERFSEQIDKINDDSLLVRKSLTTFDLALDDIDKNSWWTSKYRLEMQDLMQQIRQTGFFEN